MSKYFKYAIGEILLVVIGILIALQINNWNERRKTNIEEIRLVEQLLQDAKNDSIFFQSRLELFTAQINTFEILLDYCNGKIAPNDSTRFQNESFPFMMAANQSLVMSNKIDFNRISNAEINKSLRDYSLSYNFISLAISNNSDLVSEELRYLTKEFDFDASRDEVSLMEISSICKSPKISGIIKLCASSSLNAKKQTERFLLDNTELLEACNTFLKD